MGDKMNESERSIHKRLKKFMVTEVYEKKNGYINPVIVTFQNGELNEGLPSEWNVTLTPSTDGRTNVEIKTSYNQVFKDSKFNHTIRPTQIIAIRNKKTNKVKIVEVDSTVLINSILTSSPEENIVTTEYEKNMKALNKTFGGKKLVARLEQREKFNLNYTPVADDVMKVVEGISISENTSLNETEAESILHLLPPCHRDVKILSKVYLLNEILSEEELLALKEEVTSLKKSKTTTKEYSQFFQEHFVEAEKSDENLNDRLAGILFTECLIRFLKMPSKKVGSKNAVLCSFSHIIHNKLLNEFCTKTETSVTRPLTMRDKCVCYIIAVGLICCNYKINLKVLSLSSAVHFTRVTRLARVVGAVPLSKEETFFILKLPLPALPKSSKRKIRRK